jgi:hypothetical protein
VAKLERLDALDEHSIVEHREGTGLHLAVGQLLGRVEYNVISLTFIGLAAIVCERRVMAVIPRLCQEALNHLSMHIR